jgi:prevent-host-death family protein
MDKSISTTDAKRNFLNLLKKVSKGQSYVITSRGQPAARITPVNPQSQKREATK